MKMMIDYKKDLKKSYRLMKGKSSPERVESAKDEFVGNALQTLSQAMPIVADKVKKRVAKLIFHLDNVARINGGKIEINLDKEKRILQILCVCDGYYVISKEKDLTREGFFHLCDYADSFFVTNKDKRVEIDATVKME